MEAEVFEWSQLEYQHIQGILKEQFLLTQVPDPSLPSLSPIRCHRESILALPDLDRARICLLDSEAPETLCPEDAIRFDYILAGGILGDVDENDPDRTQELRIHGFPRRNLGKVQMTADTAVLTSYLILEGVRRPLEALTFVDRPSFKIASKEVIEMPFRYLDRDALQLPLSGSDRKVTALTGPSPLLPKGMVSLWKKEQEGSIF